MTIYFLIVFVDYSQYFRFKMSVNLNNYIVNINTKLTHLLVEGKDFTFLTRRILCTCQCGFLQFYYDDIICFMWIKILCCRMYKLCFYLSTSWEVFLTFHYVFINEVTETFIQWSMFYLEDLNEWMHSLPSLQRFNITLSQPFFKQIMCRYLPFFKQIMCC